MTRISFILVWCLTLAACGNLAAPESQAAAPAAAISAIACPAQDFDAFVHAFANDVRYQKVFVADPLQSESVDAAAEPEPKLVIKMLTASQLKFPLMLDDQMQMRDGLQAKQTVLNANEISVTLFKEDTDYQITYFFRKISGCWQLYRILNASL